MQLMDRVTDLSGPPDNGTNATTSLLISSLSVLELCRDGVHRISTPSHDFAIPFRLPL